MNKIKYHKLSSYFPMLPSDEFDKLKSSISDHGLLEPITLLDGKILDGRNRYEACIELGIEPKFRDVLNEVAPLDFVFDANMRRRHLTEPQKTQITFDIRGISKPIQGKRTDLTSQRDAKSPTRREIANEAGVSAETVRILEEVQDDDEIKAQLREGSITAREAVRERGRKMIDKGKEVKFQKDEYKASPSVKTTITNLRWIIRQDWSSGLEQGKVDVRGHVPRIVKYIDEAIEVLTKFKNQLLEEWEDG